MQLCPWSLASSIPVFGLERFCPRKGCPWPRIFFASLALALASSLVSSTPPLSASSYKMGKLVKCCLVMRKKFPEVKAVVESFVGSGILVAQAKVAHKKVV